ncbi:DUF6233 domain-containing protein [Streptomyces sp. ET3-23]|uniref:DUF6233 domain-containing protein n=1 Tax=Streptomyces sp. ET3-23 TaxID=2885643 RepID=UPI001D0F846A|nr:DUF6233 domain-containing protein [Streptomyces sp. ET3-23]MCC2280528.1 DUF6233 domain-containing protein [Streptomyces sp. ET3-23]
MVAHPFIAGRDLCEPSDVHFTVPSTHVEPLEGTSYRGVPIRRHPKAIARARTGRSHPAPPPTPQPAAPASGASQAPDAPAADTDRWKIQQMRRAYDSTGPRRTVVHHQDCWMERGPADLTTEQAVKALRRPGAEPCEACGAGRLQT